MVLLTGISRDRREFVCVGLCTDARISWASPLYYHPYHSAPERPPSLRGRVNDGNFLILIRFQEIHGDPVYEVYTFVRR